MNFPSPTQALQARAQPGGITPELIRLLAQMKVKQETEAAARDMAMKMGQQPPTVADSVNAELEGNARQQIAQKLGGLQALSQQQAPQGAPTMPAPPAQPTQHMAAGGLARVPSNLPTRYAGGGIVAFDAGGPAWTDRRPRETEGDYAIRMERGENFNDSDIEGLKDKLYEIANLVPRGIGRLADLIAPADAQQPASLYAPRVRVVPDVRRQELQEGEPAVPADHIPTYAAPKAAPSRANVPASGRPAPVVAQPAVPPTPVSGLGAIAEKYMADKLQGDSSKVEPAAREEFSTRYQRELGPEEAALRAQRQQDYEQAKAAQAARDAKGELSIWDRLGTLGQNAAYGNWGRAAGQQRNMELAHEATKAEGAKGLLALKQAADAMSLADKKALFSAAESKGAAAALADAAAKKDVLGDASRLLGTQGTNAAHIQGIGMTNATQLQIANIQAATQKAAAKIAADRQEQVDKRNDITGLKSEIAAAENTLKRYTPQALMLLTPGTPEHAEAVQEMAWAKAVREQNRARLAELTGVEYKTAPGAGAAAPSNLVKVIGVKP